MLPLVQKEFVLLRKQLLQIAVIVILIGFVGRIDPGMGFAYLAVFPVVFAMSIPQLSFSTEERANTLAFLKTLPIPPGVVVGSKYVFTAATVLLLELFIVFFGLVMLRFSVENARAVVSVTMLLTCLLSSLSLFVHYWLGIKSAKTVLQVGRFTIVIIAITLGMNEGALFMSLQEWAASVASLAASPAGPFGASAIGALLLLVSWYGATRIFATRDVTKL